MSQKKYDWKGVIAKKIKEIVLTNPRWRFPTVRSIFYYLADTLQLIPLTEYGYKKVDEIAVELRLKGEIPFGYFDVKRGAESYTGRIAVTPQDCVSSCFRRLLKLPEEYFLPYWWGQPYHVEVWIEKIGLLPTFEKILEDFDVKIRAGEGYASWEWVYSSVESIRRFLNDRLTKKVVVLYFGDLDPSGVDIDKHVKNAIEFFNVDLEFKRVALFPWQVKKYNLPLFPKRMEVIDKMMRDPRKKKYFQKYGRIACELDSFVAKAFDELRKIVIEEVSKYFDKKRLKEKIRVENEIKEILKETLNSKKGKIDALKTEIIKDLEGVRNYF